MKSIAFELLISLDLLLATGLPALINFKLVDMLLNSKLIREAQAEICKSAILIQYGYIDWPTLRCVRIVNFSGAAEEMMQDMGRYHF